MLELCHGASSVCSSKMRVGLVEKGREWNDHPVNLARGEQNGPEYLELDPTGVVPTLIDGDLVTAESSVILEHNDDLAPNNRLMPEDKAAKAKARI